MGVRACLKIIPAAGGCGWDNLLWNGLPGISTHNQLMKLNETSPVSGGAGHTIRVCRKHCIPVPDQKTWLGWDMHFS